VVFIGPSSRSPAPRRSCQLISLDTDRTTHRELLRRLAAPRRETTASTESRATTPPLCECRNSAEDPTLSSTATTRLRLVTQTTQDADAQSIVPTSAILYAQRGVARRVGLLTMPCCRWPPTPCRYPWLRSA